MFGFGKRCRAAGRQKHDFTELEARHLRQMGLNPDDIHDALKGRRSSVLFNPFRQPRD